MVEILREISQSNGEDEEGEHDATYKDEGDDEYEDVNCDYDEKDDITLLKRALGKGMKRKRLDCIV